VAAALRCEPSIESGIYFRQGRNENAVRPVPEVVELVPAIVLTGGAREQSRN
jgi:hypothetical protein